LGGSKKLNGTIYIIEFDNEIDPPSCGSNPVLESIAEVIVVSGGLLSETEGGTTKV
jgi:hypothetical protein